MWGHSSTAVFHCELQWPKMNYQRLARKERQKDRKAKGQNDDKNYQKDDRKMSERCQNVRMSELLTD